MSIFALLGLFINWYTLAFAVVLLAIAAAIYFTQGPAGLLKVLMAGPTWVFIGIVLALITLYNSSQVIQKQKQTIAVTQSATVADKDSLAVVTRVNAKKTVRAKQSVQQQAVIDKATPGTEMDDLLDEIAKEQSTEK